MLANRMLFTDYAAAAGGICSDELDNGPFSQMPPATAQVGGTHAVNIVSKKMFVEK